MSTPYRRATVAPPPSPKDRTANHAREKRTIAIATTLTIASFTALYLASRIAARDGRIPYELEVTNPLEGWLLLAFPTADRSQITPPPTTFALLYFALLASAAVFALVATEFIASHRARNTFSEAPEARSYIDGLPGFDASPRYALAYAVCAGLCLVVFLAAFAAL